MNKKTQKLNKSLDQETSEIVQAYLSKIGTKGGKVSSFAKIKAAILNGKKGGRPKKSDTFKAFLLLLGVTFSQCIFSDSINLSFIGLSAHSGEGASQKDWQYMKRKVSNVGKIVWNPEVNLTYEKNSWLFNTTYVNDCQGFNAYYVGVGKQWEITSTFKLSVVAGAYARKKYEFSDRTGKVLNTKREVIFVPWISIEKSFPLTQNISLTLKASSNYTLTHTLLGFSYNL